MYELPCPIITGYVRVYEPPCPIITGYVRVYEPPCPIITGYVRVYEPPCPIMLIMKLFCEQYSIHFGMDSNRLFPASMVLSPFFLILK